MKLYCGECKIVFDGDVRCPFCGGKKKAPPEADDVCMLCEKEQIWSEVLADVLDNNGIPHLCRNVYGAGITAKLGSMFERVIFYVKYKDLDRARDIVEELFSGEADGAEEE
ncbi:MAG: hypothetical protein IKN38_06495 [Clostridia bacterium]|nr:hypothetical protein [Clostridia bacterium]